LTSQGQTVTVPNDDISKALAVGNAIIPPQTIHALVNTAKQI
jgi:uncharacterized protein YegJ (DUF2314 family)